MNAKEQYIRFRRSSARGRLSLKSLIRQLPPERGLLVRSNIRTESRLENVLSRPSVWTLLRTKVRAPRSGPALYTLVVSNSLKQYVAQYLVTCCVRPPSM